MRLKNGEVLLRWPLARHLLTAGNYYRNAQGGYTQWHGAIDLRCAWDGTTRQPVYAAEAGRVVWVQKWGGGTAGAQSYGNAVKIEHAPYKGTKPLQTLYAHLSETAVAEGENVTEGQIIGYTGNTGNSHGAHLHFEVRMNGKRYNPLCWLDDDFFPAPGFQPYTYGPGESAVQRPALYTITVGPVTKGDFEALEQALLPVIEARGLEQFYTKSEE